MWPLVTVYSPIGYTWLVGSSIKKWFFLFLNFFLAWVLLTWVTVCITWNEPELKVEKVKVVLNKFDIDSHYPDRNATLIKQNITSHTSLFFYLYVHKIKRKCQKHNRGTNEKYTHFQLQVKMIQLVLLPCTIHESWLQSSVSTGNY